MTTRFPQANPAEPEANLPPALADLCDSTVLDAALAGSVPALPMLREALKTGTQTLQQQFEQGLAADQLVAGRCSLIDQLLQRTWQHVLQSDAEHLALVAVGGYGRGELLPHSDIDLMILLPDAETPEQTARITSFLTLLWDIGLEVGHSVRTLEDCVTQG